MNTTPTTSQVHAPGPRCCLFVFMIDRRFAQRSRNGRAGDADPSATKLGRIRALTPRVCRAAPSWWLGAGETRAIGGQVVRARDFLHPLIRGEFGGDSGEIQGRFRAAFAHRSRGCSTDLECSQHWSDAWADVGCPRWRWGAGIEAPAACRSVQPEPRCAPCSIPTHVQLDNSCPHVAAATGPIGPIEAN
jgi:hypothetical protein